MGGKGWRGEGGWLHINTTIRRESALTISLLCRRSRQRLRGSMVWLKISRYRLRPATNHNQIQLPPPKMAMAYHPPVQVRTVRWFVGSSILLEDTFYWHWKIVACKKMTKFIIAIIICRGFDNAAEKTFWFRVVWHHHPSTAAAVDVGVVGGSLSVCLNRSSGRPLGRRRRSVSQSVSNSVAENKKGYCTSIYLYPFWWVGSVGAAAGRAYWKANHTTKYWS